MSAEKELQGAVNDLWQDDLDGLYMSLATRAQAAEKGEALDELEKYDANELALPPLDAEEEGGEITVVIKKLSEKWWDILEPKLYDLLCNKENKDRDKFLEALQEGGKTLAIALAPVLVAQVAALPAVAIVLATIAAKKIAESGLEAMCDLWKESLEKEAEEEEGGEGEPE